MELKTLKTFQIVSENLNMTKTAELLGYSQPSITLQIKSLERAIGYDLIYRSGNKLFLTPTGERLRVHVNKLFEVIDYMEKDLKEFNQIDNSITIAAPEFYCSYFLPSVVSEHFKKASETELKLESRKNNDILDKVLDETVDIGIVFEFQEKIKGIKQISLKQEDFLLVISKDNFLEKNGDTALILKSFPFLSYTDDYNQRLKNLQNDCIKSIKYQPKQVIEWGSEEAIKRAILNNTGIALVTNLLIKKEIELDKIVILNRFTNKIITSLILLEEKYKHPTFRKFILEMQAIWDELMS